MTSPPSSSSSSSDDLQAEVESLRAELAEREAKSARRRKGWWRTIVATVLLVLVTILAPLSLVARWVNAEVADTDRYVATVTPLASNPDVQQAIANRISQVIFTYVDVPAVTDEAITALQDRGLSDRAVAGLQALSVPLDDAIHNFVDERVLKLVQSDAFQTAWIEANRQAHAQLVAVLEGKQTGTVDVSNNTVTINLAAFIDTVKNTLVKEGFNVASRIPAVDASFTLYQSADIGKAQKAFKWLDTAATVLPIVTLLLILGAVFVARSRRTAVIAAGLCVALGMMLLGLIIALARPLYLDALPSSVSQDAAAALYDTLVGFIRKNLRGIAFIGLIVAFIAWCVGPSTSARRLRSGTSSAVTFVREKPMGRIHTGAFGRGVWELRTTLRIAILALGTLILLLNTPITGAQVIVTVLVMLVVWLVVELLATPPEAEPAEPAPNEPAGHTP